MPPKSRRRKVEVTSVDDSVAKKAKVTKDVDENEANKRPSRARRSAAISGDEPSTSDDVPKTAPKTNGRGKTSKIQGADSNGKNEKAPVKGTGAVEVKKEVEEPKSNPKTKSIVLKSKAPVDEECPVKATTHVLCEDSDVWDCMLNQTDVGNNNNKYYMIQCLESDSGKTYYCWQRWGRVGKIAGTNLVSCGSDLSKAKSVFSKKFLDKTKNSWECRHNFVKVAGKYDLLEMDYSPSVSDPKPEKSEIKQEVEEKEIESKLDAKIQELIGLIFDVKKMTETVIEMQYDANKAPLGKLTKDQIRYGFEALKEIEEMVVKGKTGSKKHMEAVNRFYTRIPHDFGMKRPPVIGDMNTIKSKIELLEVLGDIQIAMTLMTSKAKEEKNDLDHHYDSLQCEIKALEKEAEEFKWVNSYVQKTHGKTHTSYTLDVDEVFELEKAGEKEKFNPEGLGNRRLLWHGSRLTNWSGILGQGLRIAPPEAPVTGYMFGKGVYFADMCSKSANYCFTTPTRNTGLLLLCDVALGEMNELSQADYNASKLPKGKHSTWGKGRTTPDEETFFSLKDGAVVPCGIGKERKESTSLQYNEFIVYNTNQIRMRYLVKLKFNYKYR